MNKIKKTLAILGAVLVIGTCSATAFAEEVSEANNVIINCEDYTLVTEEPTTIYDIEINTENVGTDVPTNTDAEEITIVNEEIPDTGSNETLIGIVASLLSLALVSLGVLLKSKSKTA